MGEKSLFNKWYLDIDLLKTEVGASLYTEYQR